MRHRMCRPSEKAEGWIDSDNAFRVELGASLCRIVHLMGVSDLANLCDLIAPPSGGDDRLWPYES